MRQYLNVFTAYIIMGILIILVGLLQSWGVALAILNLCLISAVMTMGANIQWGYAGLINFGIMGYVALGGLAAVLVSVPPVREAWQVGGLNMILCLFLIVLFMLPSWQLLFPNKSLQAFFLPEIDVVSQNCKTQNTPLTLRVIPEQFQTPPGRSFRTLLTSITSR